MNFKLYFVVVVSIIVVCLLVFKEGDQAPNSSFVKHFMVLSKSFYFLGFHLLHYRME